VSVLEYNEDNTFFVFMIIFGTTEMLILEYIFFTRYNVSPSECHRRQPLTMQFCWPRGIYATSSILNYDFGFLQARNFCYTL
jgi:hypothetical protein